jgi:hypothetical protein
VKTDLFPSPLKGGARGGGRKRVQALLKGKSD